jgi:hypothetical protein
MSAHYDMMNKKGSVAMLNKVGIVIAIIIVAPAILYVFGIVLLSLITLVGEILGFTADKINKQK